MITLNKRFKAPVRKIFPRFTVCRRLRAQGRCRKLLRLCRPLHLCWSHLGLELVGLLVFTALQLSLTSNSDFSAFNSTSRSHVSLLPNLRLMINLNSEGIFSITTGANKFLKDSDSIPSASKLWMFISILSYKSRSFFVSCIEMTIGNFNKASMWLEINTCGFISKKINGSFVIIVSERQPINSRFGCDCHTTLQISEFLD